MQPSILSLIALFPFASLALGHSSKATCKANPIDGTWPRYAQWMRLNDTLGGILIATSPVASACYNGTGFDSPYSCQTVESNWTSSIFHAAQPESIGAWVFANNSCVPLTESDAHGCQLGGLPSYVVNATTERQIATALRWAGEHNVRVVVKGTGHDLNGRSSGAFGLSIWTRHFRQLSRNTSWSIPGKANRTTDVIVAGSGFGWGDVLDFAMGQGRVVTTGQDPSVGLGGYIQGGGHGPLASTYGLAAQQVLQATVVLPTGEIVTANEAEHCDIFWAVRGGGAGQYGVVTEFVIKDFPAPLGVSSGTISIAPSTETGADASWDAATLVMQALPDWMDAGLAGAMSLASGSTGSLFSTSAPPSTKGAVVVQSLWAFNKTKEEFDDVTKEVRQELQAQAGNRSISITYSSAHAGNYSTFYKTISGSGTAGSGGVSSSHLLGRRHLDIPHEQLKTYLKRALVAQNETEGTYMTVGLSGGLGVFNHSSEQFGALIPAWKSAYLHLLVGGASTAPNATLSPRAALSENARWLEEHKEKLWQEWAPDSGAYMNEGNPYAANFKKDFYGTNYDTLLETKQRVDPKESMFVLSGVGSDRWDYNLQSGKLCRVAQ